MIRKSGIETKHSAAVQAVSLSKEEVQRYSRHLIMPKVGLEGQLKLKQARVLCIGTGGLGAPLSLYLAAAGVGRIGSWISTPSTQPIFSARFSSAHPMSDARRWRWPRLDCED